jgi:hypothetical protein
MVNETFLPPANREIIAGLPAQTAELARPRKRSNFYHILILLNYLSWHDPC